MGEPRRKSKHFQIIGRSANGDFTEFHVGSGGAIRKHKPVDIHQPKWLTAIPAKKVFFRPPRSTSNALASKIANGNRQRSLHVAVPATIQTKASRLCRDDAARRAAELQRKTHRSKH